MDLWTIGVTGGIGSGKSTVSGILRDLGAAIVDADAIARIVTGKGGKALEELTGYFGTGILSDSGELNRKKLADLVFNDPVKLHALDSITHKYIVEKMNESIKSIRVSGKIDVVVVDAPIPLEHGFLDLVDEVWVVVADHETRIRRIMERSGYSSEEALERMHAQMKDEEYLKIADEVIQNNRSIEELEQAVVRLFLHRKQDRQR